MPSPTPRRSRMRRYMVIASFTTLVLLVPGILILIAFGDETTGEKMAQGGAVLAPVVTFLTAMVWKYFHRSRAPARTAETEKQEVPRDR